ncbi:WYL domain-containing protein [Clostridium sporogenes]|uniref:helix-turn-helix transcriptional regulator n=1 Tax=Clostridium sporogenes TaxID=1509 RepID=UPI0013D13A61|nr:WYL domain-containing protein [Clostridium sporogenes]NFE81114.1 WYL domain-containing protein [Clostridium sporogenes]NFG68010.1 WYL domain-containing protein [Clostridium sporogenes]
MTKANEGKANRILTIYEKLIKGEVIYKKQLAMLFGVNEKTIQRDIDDIRTYLSNNRETKGNINVEYKRDKKGYCINRREDVVLNRKDVLAISKILLESRAFCKEEIIHLINTLLDEVNSEQRKYVKELIGNELLNYVPLRHNDRLLSKIWDLSEFIRHKEMIEVSYVKTDGSEVNRILKPVAIIFSEYYFYLIAYFNDLIFDDPAVFRIDRIKKYKGSRKKFYISESERFEDGQFRNRIQFMYSGKLMKIKFEFSGTSLEAILDRLPTAKVIEQCDDKYIIEAEVFGKGIMMWILSQGSRLKVIYPNSLIEEIKNEIKKFKNIYKEGEQ